MNTTPEFLFENEEGYKSLFDNAHDLIHFVSPAGKLIYVNKSWTSLLGYTQEEIRDKSLLSFIAPSDKDRFKRYREDVINGKKAEESIVVGLQTKSGSQIKIEGFILVEHKNNEFVYTTGIFRDVTKSLENEAKLKQSNQQLQLSQNDLQQLLIHAPDAVIVVNEQDIIQLWNPKAEAIFGWTAGEAIGQSLANTIVPPQHRQAHNYGIKRYLETGIPHILNKTVEVSALHKSGTEFYISLTISNTRQKGAGAFIAFIRDITHQKNTEKELEKNQVELQTSNQQLEQFAHVASHDMKEPIRKIRTFAERLACEFESTLPETAAFYVSKIQKSALRLTNMVDGVLNYSIATGNNDPFEEVNLNTIIKNIEEDLELPITEKSALIIYANLPLCEGVPFLIYQLFYNLINNSLKFSRAGVPPVISIEAVPNFEYIKSNKDQNVQKNTIVITVRDNGIGFEQQYADRIFNTFARLNSKDQFEGTGLGLALCKNIAERHGGYIKAKGDVDEGASFAVVLPQKQLNII